MDGKTRWLFIYANSSHKTAKKRTSRPITPLWNFHTARSNQDDSDCAELLMAKAKCPIASFPRQIKLDFELV
jgi:hypothetical protein